MTSSKTALLSVVLLLLPWSLSAQELRQSIESYVDAHQKEILTDLMGALAIPPVAADTANIRRKAEFLHAQLARRGLVSEILETDGNPLVFGELSVSDADRTLLLYCHYDGQPADPSKWRQSDPFKPVLRDNKLSDTSKIVDFDAAEDFQDDLLSLKTGFEE